MDATASGIATCIIAMAREPSGAALGPSGVARIVLIPMRFQNVTVFPDSVLRANASPELELRAGNGAWPAASGPACNATVARTTTSMAAKLRVIFIPFLLRAATGRLDDCPEARLRRRAAPHLSG